MDPDHNARKDTKYGVPNVNVRAVDKVAIKRPGSPQSVVSISRKASDSYEPTTPLRRESTSSVATSLDGLNYQELHRAAFINQGGSAQNLIQSHTSSRWAVRAVSLKSSASPISRNFQEQKSAQEKTMCEIDVTTRANSGMVTVMSKVEVQIRTRKTGRGDRS
ncbi:hypothetical protein NDA11_007454 [Ustilago hordei]|nr:hypothetical protein NDA11_007454 [Ustilago hordei]